jgi:hypothetical protein
MKRTIDGIDYNTNEATWVAKVEDGGKVAAILYQRPVEMGGQYFFHRVAGNTIEPITEFEAKRLMRDLVESAQIAAVMARAEQAFADLGVKFEPSVTAQVRERVHTELRRRGLIKGSAPNMRKLLGSKGADR